MCQCKLFRVNTIYYAADESLQYCITGAVVKIIFQSILTFLRQFLTSGLHWVEFTCPGLETKLHTRPANGEELAAASTSLVGGIME